MGAKFKSSTVFHPTTDGQLERTIQTLEDMLRSCVLDFKGSLDQKLPLIKFSYKSMAPFEALYGMKCRSPSNWVEVGRKQLQTTDDIRKITDEIKMINQGLDIAFSQEKSYADKCQRPLEFQVGDSVFIKKVPMKGIMRISIKEKLSPKYIGPYEIFERIGKVAYKLALLPELASVHDVFTS